MELLRVGHNFFSLPRWTEKHRKASNNRQTDSKYIGAMEKDYLNHLLGMEPSQTLYTK